MTLKKVLAVIGALLICAGILCIMDRYRYINGRVYSTDSVKLELDSHYSNRQSLQNLKYFDSLEELSVSFFSETEMEKIGAVLKEINQIKRLNIYMCDVDDWSFLNYLNDLEQIHILETEVDLTDISENASLEKLDIINCNIIGIENLKLFYNLKNVYISVVREVDILNFTDLKHLTTLKLTTIDTIKNIDKLSLLKGLENFTVRNISDLGIEYKIFESMLNLNTIEVSENIISDDCKELLNKKGINVTIIADK